MFDNQELNRKLTKIQTLIAEVKERFEPDDELRSHMAKYICVLTSGFIENAVYYIFSDMVENETESEMLLSYAKSQLLKVQNPNSEKLRNLTKSFNPDWLNDFREYLQDENRGAAINYILKDRHKIAHGKDSEITITALEGYLQKTVDVFSYLENEYKNYRN